VSLTGKVLPNSHSRSFGFRQISTDTHNKLRPSRSSTKSPYTSQEDKVEWNTNISERVQHCTVYVISTSTFT